MSRVKVCLHVSFVSLARAGSGLGSLGVASMSADTTDEFSKIIFVVLYCNFRSLPFLGLLGFLLRQPKV